MTLGSLQNSFALVQVNSEISSPFFNVRIVGNVSKVVYGNTLDFIGYLGQTVLIYWGLNPTEMYPNFPHVELAYNAAESTGPQLPSEDILYVTLATDPAASAYAVNFAAYNLSFFNDNEIIHQLLVFRDPCWPACKPFSLELLASAPSPPLPVHRMKGVWAVLQDRYALVTFHMNPVYLRT
jgi:hypothetical protein